jgi:hypothetical protein
VFDNQKGLTIVASVLEGPLLSRIDHCKRGHKSLRAAMNRNLVQGFPQVIAAESVMKGIMYLIQGSVNGHCA